MSDAATSEQQLSFEQALEALQQTVAQIEGGQLSLDESLQHYEAGMRMLRLCYGYLERAEQRIEQFISLDAQGQLQTAPFDAQATHQAPTPTAGKPTRKRPPKSDPPPAASGTASLFESDTPF